MLESSNYITYEDFNEINYSEILRDIIKLKYPWVFEDEKSLQDFLTPSIKNIHPSSGLKNIQTLTAEVVRAIHLNKKIVIFGDYDVDGITAATLWHRFLNYIQFTNFKIIIPSRFDHGYGLSEASMDLILEHEPDFLMTVDNGINTKEIVEQLQDKGIQVVITDHHNPIPEKLPNCPIVNPKLPGCSYPDKHVTGAGVAFLVIAEVRRIFREEGLWNSIPEPNLVADLDLVALGTIADQAPLIGLNRIFVHYGLLQIKNRVHQYEPSYYNYLRAIYEDMPNFENYPVDPEFLSFKISPLINSAGRMENGDFSVKFITAPDPSSARFWLQKLKYYNQQRLAIQTQMLSVSYVQAREQEIRGGLVIYSPDFHEGVTGIIAGKLCNEFRLPVVVLAAMTQRNELKGSCRSPDGCSILEILKGCEEILSNYGGHDSAAGCTMEMGLLGEFKNLFYKNSLIELGKSLAHNEFIADFDIPLEMVNTNFYSQLKRLEPHGTGHNRPIFLSRGIKVKKIQPFGRNNLRWDVQDNLTAIFWNFNLPNHLISGPVDIAYEIKEGNVSGNDTLLMNVKKISSKGFILN